MTTIIIILTITIRVIKSRLCEIHKEAEKI